MFCPGLLLLILTWNGVSDAGFGDQLISDHHLMSRSHSISIDWRVQESHGREETSSHLPGEDDSSVSQSSQAQENETTSFVTANTTANITMNSTTLVNSSSSASRTEATSTATVTNTTQSTTEGTTLEPTTVTHTCSDTSSSVSDNETTENVTAIAMQSTTAILTSTTDTYVTDVSSERTNHPDHVTWIIIGAVVGSVLGLILIILLVLLVLRKTKKKSEYPASDEPQGHDARRESIRPTSVQALSNKYSETPNNENIGNNNTTSGSYTYVTIPSKESNSVSDRGNDDTILKDNSLYASGIRDIALVNQENDDTLLVDNSLYSKEVNVSASINYDTILVDNSLYVRN